MAIRSLLSRPFDLLVVIFFLTHIPITVFIDSQAGRKWQIVSQAVEPFRQLCCVPIHAYGVQFCQEHGMLMELLTCWIGTWERTAIRW